MFDKIFKNIIGDFGKISIKHGSREFELKKNDFGKIFCETSLIERVTEKIAKKVKGVHSAKVTVDKPFGVNSPLKASFIITLKQNFSANEVSSEICKEVKKYLKEMCEIVDVTVDIKITGVEQVEKKRRVR